jgi:23S rRNA pseudouridine1911/1915/1917 synthase
MTADYRSAPPPSPAIDDPSGEADTPWAEDVERRGAIVTDLLHGHRLDKALVSIVAELSRSYLQTLVQAGHVRVDGRVVTVASRKVLAGHRIDVELVPTPQSQAFRPEPIPLTVVFEDEHVLVLNKPAGLVVHPAAGNWSGTVLNGLLAHHAQSATLPRAGIVHRLDKDTSGLMVVGKTLPAVTALVRAISMRDVHREYLAIAHGVMREDHLCIDAPIGRDPQSRVRMSVLASGKAAMTDVDVRVRGALCTGVTCTLHTGRTHQIRVHLASRGHPLVGDVTYGGAPALGMQRQALHATRLALNHPITGLPLSFVAPAPPDLAAAWDRIDAAH